MDDTAKYLIHASITADGVVERSDVVGAVFGQTEGLLGEELDLRDLQQSSKVGRIDVEIDSENGQSFGRLTIASSLDKVETAILAASLETITRIGPCQSVVEVTNIEDVREAKRRKVVERAKELLAESFDENAIESREILEEVRESVRVEDIDEFHGFPAGPHVADSDAIIVVEGRADVLTLLEYGIKNAIAVEGTNIPDEVAQLTKHRTVTAFLDGDRGGELILRELAQVGDVDYVVFAPEDRSVEDLAHHEVMSALRGKVPYDTLSSDGDLREAAKATVSPAGSPHVTPGSETAAEGETEPETEDGDASDDGRTDEPDTDADSDTDEAASTEGTESTSETDETGETTTPRTLRGHVRDVVGESAGLVRLLDEEFEPLVDAPADEAFDALVETEQTPYAVVVDGEIGQRLLDVAAQRGIEQVVGRSAGEYVKKPVSVRVRTSDELTASSAEADAGADVEAD